MTLVEAIGAAPFVFVVGKGGTGKTTTAGAIALALADAGEPVHLLSTDPAHSVGALFAQPLGAGASPSRCTDGLLLEELDAAAAAERFLRRATGPVSDIVERGTYLDGEDVAGFTRLAVPGVDEMMALLRLVELAEGGRRVVVDTAPTGHTLRLLDAAATQEGLATALRAMADKASAVASSLARTPLRLAGESFIDELDAAVADWRSRVLGRAAFVLADRPGAMVAAETRRLEAGLRARMLSVAACVTTGEVAGTARATGAPHFAVPLLDDPHGCGGLRVWLRQVRPVSQAGAVSRNGGTPDVPGGSAQQPVTSGSAGPAADHAATWLEALPQRVLLFAGKGGVGKTTCAAAAALLLARTRDVVLCSTDPAGSLDDVFGRDVTGAGRVGERLRAVQVDAAAAFRQWRVRYRDEVLDGLAGVGLTEAAALDRRVIEALLDLAPPGIDEFAALAALLDATARDEVVVLDTAPTGHFLRLLTMPALALDWTRQLMRIMVKYRVAGTAGDAAGALLRTARELRSLQELLRDPARAGIVVVTLDEPLVRAETERLVDVLRADGAPLLARLLNRGSTGPAPVAEGSEPTVYAPAWPHGPVGESDLEEFAGTWMMLS